MNNDELICQVCRREGHKRGAIVKTTSGLRNLKYCICCGRILRPEKGSATPSKSGRLKGLRRGSRPPRRTRR